MNDLPFNHHSIGVEFISSRCDFKGTVYVAVYDTSELPDTKTIMKATASMIGYHACNIHKELNGFAGYDAIHYEFVDQEQARKLKKEFGLNVD